jgi:protein-S-isoprenylcysteine O-methyltransferase Ste14
MNLLPDWSLGILHCWILVLPVWIAGMMIGRSQTLNFKRATDVSWYTNKDRLASIISMGCMILYMILSVFIPLSVGSWMFYLGLLLLISGYLGHILAKIHYAQSNPDEPVHRGIYRYSRNPMYVSFSLIMLGVAFIGQSILLLVIWAGSTIATHILIRGEERYCIETYGESYDRYLKQTPRYFLFF